MWVYQFKDMTDLLNLYQSTKIITIKRLGYE
jgi:hypothetical protein